MLGLFLDVFPGERPVWRKKEQSINVSVFVVIVDFLQC